MNLNKEFKQAIIDNQYYYSAFDGKIHDINDLQVCHILSQSKRTLNCIKKAYDCNTKTAGLLMNMPLLNTVIGTRQDNAEYKKTDDIVYIDYRILHIVHDIIHTSFKYISFIDIEDTVLCKFYNGIQRILSSYNEIKNSDFCELIKYYQYQFHKEIDLHI